MHVTVNEKTNVISVTTTEEKSSVVIATSQGPAGPRGPAGDANVAGYPIDVAELRTGDVLIFSGVAWVNENKVTLTDGGNF